MLWYPGYAPGGHAETRIKACSREACFREAYVVLPGLTMFTIIVVIMISLNV